MKGDSGKTIEQRMQFEALITDLSARLIKVQMAELDGEIERLLTQVREFFEAESSVGRGQNTGSLFSEKSRAGIRAEGELRHEYVI